MKFELLLYIFSYFSLSLLIQGYQDLWRVKRLKNTVYHPPLLLAMTRHWLSLFIGVVAFSSFYYVKHLTGKEVSIDPLERSSQIETMVLQSWSDYVRNGWGKDIYHPISHQGNDNMAASKEPLGWIIVDTIDTLLLLLNNTQSEHRRDQLIQNVQLCTEWCQKVLSYDIDSPVNIFETTIRMLGGLLSAYHLTQTTANSTIDGQVFLTQAVDLAERIKPAFYESPSGIPYSSINLHSGEAIRNHVDNGASSTAEFTTLQLEFKYLAYITGVTEYWSLAEQVYKPLYAENDLLNRYDGLCPIYTIPDTAKFHGNNIRFGSRGDSFYEYLLKQYLQSGEPIYYELYRESIEGMKRHLVRHSSPSGFLYIAEKPWGLHNPASAKMDHLVCFMGGLLAMGATEGYKIEEARRQPWWDSIREEDWHLATDLTHTCYQMYHQTPSGLAPEIVVFNDKGAREVKENGWWKSPTGDFYIKPLDAHNLQRPETVESIMFLYHLTGDKKYREWGAEILESFEKNTCIHCDDASKKAYSSLDNVINEPFKRKDNVESFWLAETLKYLYLLFQEDVDLKSTIFNTEAHPFPKMDRERLLDLNLSTGWSI
ncbi:mannosyl-oligosaccharide 1,2-alpha-mannosidase KNAG_0B06730 [Huiozyma naganishii CBS 8797]|uniref:alpha-1,2-Mannosidase n=1 Tax=Huiozyma naganishii (strain ATCC MYA-139 / BCRC 22969 / CBS 8797 / KCTC 17520 / NBRC 10181 / NCYC 3082 / Yp74L-3) TaxID=1071383 RepID=J7RHS8_HUIN7|nr:hypothetical protein KNAG_0B06730 [Kazachstania naganishii CBS 8797]CCK69098.1 hypothetical protein KNAG_0B06730 [Kazachstania naganishii CBS 8797]